MAKTTELAASAEPTLGRFQELLRSVFRFDTGDLDFGIYRLLNAKSEDVERFVADELPEIVARALEDYASGEREVLEEQLAGLRHEVRTNFGDDALDNDGDVTDQFRDTPLGRRFAETKEQVARAQVAEVTQASIFSDLHRFFDRYYLEGDFVPRRRYGKDDAYVIPYHGENVLLYWANRDQYYVKSDDVFRAYSFRAGSGRVGFLINVKEEAPPDEEDLEAEDASATKARFILLQNKPLKWDDDESLLRVSFVSRTLTAKEAKAYPAKQQAKIQSQINEATLRTLLEETVALGKPCETLGGAESLESLLALHLERYTKRNASDFFVHRDLRGFLSRELNFFIAHDVLALDDVLSGEATELQLARARVVRDVGNAVISFLAQIEDLQRFLFEKPKFVLATHYCATLDRLSDGVVATALSSKEQRDEWKRLYKVTVAADAEPATLRDEQPHLVVDTANFDEDFKWKFLAGFDDVDDTLDGVLVKSESFHALRLLTPRYRDSVQSAYIDPPFNTDGSQFLYRDTYRDSCWLTLIANRVEAAKPLLKKDAGFFLHLDENSNYYARFLMDSLFGRANFHDEIIWRIGWVSGYKTQAKSFVRNHETIFLYGAKGKPYFAKERMAIPYHDLPIGEVSEAVDTIIAKFELDNPEFARKRLVFSAPDGTIYKVTEGDEKKSGEYWVEDTWNSNEYEQLDSNKIKRNVAEYTPNGSLLTQKPEQLLQRAILATSNEQDFVLDFFAGSGTTPAVAKKLNRRFIAVEPGAYFDSDVLWRMKQVLFGKQVGISKHVGHVGGGFFKYEVLESYDDAIENVAFNTELGGLGAELFGSEYAVSYAFGSEAVPDAMLPDSITDPFNLRLRLSGTGGEEAPIDLVETFNALTGLRVRKCLAVEHEGKTYRCVIGEHDGKRWLVIWRPFEATDDEALERDRSALAEVVLPETIGKSRPDRIYVNGECALEGAESSDALLARLLSG